MDMAFAAASLTAELTGSAYTSRVILSGRSHRGARGGGGDAGAADLWPCLVLAHAVRSGITMAATKIPAQKHRRTIIHRCEAGHIYAADYFHTTLFSLLSLRTGDLTRPSASSSGLHCATTSENRQQKAAFEVQIWGDLSFRTFSALSRSHQLVTQRRRDRDFVRRSDCPKRTAQGRERDGDRERKVI